MFATFSETFQATISNYFCLNFISERYLFRQDGLGSAIARMATTIRAALSSSAGTVNALTAVQWGSVYDSVVRIRGTINFSHLAKAGNIDIVWVDDAPSYPHTFAMDYLRSNLPTNTWLANEIDNPRIADDETYYNMAKDSYDHGCAIISVANWDLDSLVNRTSTLFQRIAADFLSQPVASKAVSATLQVSSIDIFNQGKVPDPLIEQHNTLSSGGNWVQVQLNQTCRF